MYGRRSVEVIALSRALLSLCFFLCNREIGCVFARERVNCRRKCLNNSRLRLVNDLRVMRAVFGRFEVYRDAQIFFVMSGLFWKIDNICVNLFPVCFCHCNNYPVFINAYDSK